MASRTDDETGIAPPQSIDQASLNVPAARSRRAADSARRPASQSASGRRAAGARIARSTQRRSATRVAIAPIWFSVPNALAPLRKAGSAREDGRSPTTPQKLAGLRRLAPRSEPSATIVMPQASAAAPPPDDPPTVRDRSNGLRVLPSTWLKVCAPAAN